MQLKNLFVLVIVIATIISCNTKNNDGNFSISGTVKGVKTAQIYIQPIDKNKSKVDTINVVNGKFNYQSPISFPQLAFIIFNNNATSIDAKNTKLFFIEPNAKMAVTIDTTATDRIVIIGSKATDELNAMRKKYFANIEAEEKKSFDNIDPMTLDKAAMDSLMKKYDVLQQQKKDAILQYIKANKNSYVGAAMAYYLTMQEQELDIKFLENVYALLGNEIKNSFYGTEFKNSIEVVGKTSIGATAPNFTATTIDNKPFELASYYKGKKLLLIDFWASWCGPCRKENPNVVAAYSQFHIKGFDVVGVSLDENKSDWQQAVEKDKLTWLHVSDLKGWQSEPAHLYNVSSIPTNFLIDGNGKIIAKDLRENELKEKLTELLK